MEEMRYSGRAPILSVSVAAQFLELLLHGRDAVFGILPCSNSVGVYGRTFSGIAATSGRESGMRAPGDFGLDPLGFKKGDADKFKRLEAQEIANGRLAMWAAAGEIMQGMTTDEGALGNLMSALKDNSF